MCSYSPTREPAPINGINGVRVKLKTSNGRVEMIFNFTLTPLFVGNKVKNNRVNDQQKYTTDVSINRHTLFE